MSLKDQHRQGLLSGLVSNNTHTYTVPTGERWHVFACAIQYISDATVGARQVVLEYTDGTNVVGTVGRAPNQAASLTVHIGFAEGLVPSSANLVSTHPMVPAVIEAGGEVIVRDIAGISSSDTMRILLSVIQEQI